MSTTLVSPSAAHRARQPLPTLGRSWSPPRPHDLSFPLSCAAPPYDRDRFITLGGERPLPAGAVLIVDVSPVPGNMGALDSALRQIRGSAPDTPLVMRAAPSIDDLLLLATWGAALPAQGLILQGQPLASALRGQLTRPRSLPTEITAWIAGKGIRMAPALTDFIRQVFARAAEHSEVSTLCREIGAVESSARFRCSKKRLPPPSRWLQAARALHACLRLQADPDRALLPLALELGYADHSALSHQIRRTFGVRPSEVRRTLGWEWLMGRWLTLARARMRR